MDLANPTHACENTELVLKHTHTHTHTHTRAHTHMHIYIHTHMHTCIYTHTHTCAGGSAQRLGQNRRPTYVCSFHYDHVLMLLGPARKG